MKRYSNDVCFEAFEEYFHEYSKVTNNMLRVLLSADALQGGGSSEMDRYYSPLYELIQNHDYELVKHIVKDIKSGQLGEGFAEGITKALCKRAISVTAEGQAIDFGGAARHFGGDDGDDDDSEGGDAAQPRERADSIASDQNSFDYETEVMRDAKLREARKLEIFGEQRKILPMFAALEQGKLQLAKDLCFSLE